MEAFIYGYLLIGIVLAIGTMSNPNAFQQMKLIGSNTFIAAALSCVLFWPLIPLVGNNEK